MKHIAISVIAAALLAPLTLAQQEEARIEDVTLDAFPPAVNAWADVTGAAIALLEADTLRLSVEMNVLPEIQPGAAYCIVFSDGTSDRYGCLAAVPDINYFRGPWREDGPGTTESASGSYSTGPGGTVTVEFPLELLVKNATMISKIRAYSLDMKLGASPLPMPVSQFVFLDEAAGDATLALPARTDPLVADPDANARPAASASENTGAAAAPSTEPSHGQAAVPGPGLVMILLALGVVLITRR